MTDRELLESAAKAAGLTIEYWAANNYPVVRDGAQKYGWNPLYYDSDALRLAVRRGFEIDIDLELKRTVVHTQDMSAGAKEAHGDDPGLATRRAIVRAAAADAGACDLLMLAVN